MIKLGSLFDGSGGFPLAGVLNDIEPVWASEIEPFPIRVTKLRFPNMKHLGSVTDVNGAEVEPVDIITFGSPCQDLSVAGKQAGIHEGERSNLFFEAIRIIKEMRNGTANKYPRFAVWENVPGAFSSGNGDDFRAVLEAFCSVCQQRTDVPKPPEGGWKPAGCVLGDGFSIAWRVYDAQYWGVPQRRKRIYLIADFGSERAGEILFESDSVSGDSEQGRSPWQRIAENAEGSAERGGICYPINTMVATRGGKDDMRTTFGIGEANEPQFTLQAAHEHGVCYENAEILRGVASNMTARQYKSADDLVVEEPVVYPCSMGSDETRSNPQPGDPAPTLVTNENIVVSKKHKYIVRRLTPTECARLQGFPDWWTDGAEGSDSAKYKMWGNGIALPCAEDVIRRIAEEIRSIA